MRKLVSVFVLLALLLSALPGIAIAQGPPPGTADGGEAQGQPIPGSGNVEPLRLYDAGPNFGTPLSALTPDPPPPAPDEYEECDWVWVIDQCFPGHMDTGCRSICSTGCNFIPDWRAKAACYAGCNAACWVPSYCTGHWEWFCG